MSVYPMDLQVVSLNHKGGTKSYHLYFLVNAEGKTLFINRWGKTGQFGELQVHQFDTEPKGWSEFEKKFKAKVAGGYQSPAAVPGHQTILSASELPQKLGLPIFNKIGATAVNFIDPDFPTKNMARGANPPRLDEDGRLIEANTSRNLDVSDQLTAKKQIEEEAQRAAYASNPNFGRF